MESLVSPVVRRVVQGVYSEFMDRDPVSRIHAHSCLVILPVIIRRHRISRVARSAVGGRAKPFKRAFPVAARILSGDVGNGERSGRRATGGAVWDRAMKDRDIRWVYDFRRGTIVGLLPNGAYTVQVVSAGTRFAGWGDQRSW